MLNFTKMHGLGNDFVVIDNTDGTINLSTQQIKHFANRHFGIGFDQLLMVESSKISGVDFAYTIYNADGSKSEQCGNGARCFARFVNATGLTKNNPIKVETSSGIIELFIDPSNPTQVRVDMGKPSFSPQHIGLLLPQADHYQIEGLKWGAVSMGNPHLVVIVDDFDLDIPGIATKIQNSNLLRNSANIGFMQIIDADEINLRVYERGVGETLACGSGACAAVAYGMYVERLNAKVVVHLRGGDVLINYQENKHITLLGPAEFVFTGKIKL